MSRLGPRPRFAAVLRAEQQILFEDLAPFLFVLVERRQQQLAVGQSIHVSDLELPAGVAAVTRPGASPVVATALVPRIVVEVEEVAAPAAEAVAGEAAVVEGAKPGEKTAEKGADKPAEKAADKVPAKKDDKK